MGSQICPGSTKDFIQGFRELEKGEKEYHPFFKCCMNSQTVQAQELLAFLDYFQGKDKQNQQSTYENSKLEGQSLVREQNQLQVQLLKQKNHEKSQVQQVLIKEVVNLLFPDGWRYKGQAIGSIPEGKGEEFGPNGEHFTGNFSKGKKQGNGVYKFGDASIYVGEFKDNFIQGFGIFEFSNGDRFEGQFVKNAREGKGKYILHQPNIDDLLFFQGVYKNGMKNGPGLLKYSSYEVQGTWKDGNYYYSFQDSKGY